MVMWYIYISICFCTCMYVCMGTLCVCVYRLLGNGILTVQDNDMWKLKRQLYDPAFTKRYVLHVQWWSELGMRWYDPFSYLRTLLVPFNEITNKFLDQLKPFADGASRVPIKLQFGEFVLDVLSKVKKVWLSCVVAKQCMQVCLRVYIWLFS